MLKEKQLKQENTKKLFGSNNKCLLVGKLAGKFEFNNESHGENFYSNIIKVERLSGYLDEIPIIVSDKMKEIDFSKDYTDVDASLLGTVRTYNYKEKGRSHLKVYVLVSAFAVQEEQENNFVYLEGYVCKEPIYRKTPVGKRIADMTIAVDSSRGRSYYIPCIAWHKNAEDAAEYQVGDHVRIKGRFQSRVYLKRYSDKPKDTEEKTAYEISIYSLEKLL